MTKIKKLFESRKSIKYAAAAVSGVLASLTLLVPQLFALTYISLIPLFYALFLCGKSYRTSFLLFLVYGFVYFLIVYTWFLSLNFDSGENVNLIYVSIGIWIAVGLIQGIQFSFVGLLYRTVKPQRIYKALSLPFIWIIIEWFQEQTVWGFPWGRLAISQYAFLPAIQSASLFGSLFVSFIIVLCNCLVAYGLTCFDSKKVFKTALIACAAVFAANTLFGVIRIGVVSARQYDTVKTASLQGNLPSGEKWENGGLNSFDVYMDLSIQAAENGAKIILWSETAVPVNVIKDGFYDNSYKNFAKTNEVYLIVGGFYEKDGENYSVLIMYTPDGESGIINPYKKRRLVPFGEYVPYREIVTKLFPFMNDFRMLGTDLTPSDKTVIFETEYGKMSGLICYDSIFSFLARKDVKNGSQLLLIGTNDSYYSDSLNPYQHNGQAVFRAIENGRYLIRSANNGISSIITPYGNIIVQSEMNTREVLYADAAFIDSKTLYSVLGEVMPLFGAFFCITLFIKRIVKRQKKI